MPDAIFVGVGGQGLITLSTIFYHAMRNAGQNACVKNVKGLAQRGGAVNSKASWGRSETEAIPDYIRGSLDYLVAIEQLEGLKYLPHLRDGGTALISNRQIHPSVSLLEKEPYPADPAPLIAKFPGVTVKIIDAASIAASIGTNKSDNVVMLGALLRVAGLEKAHFYAAINELMPEKLHAQNIKALDAGYDMYE